MSVFHVPPKFMVYCLSNEGSEWVPCLFTHRDTRPYFLASDDLAELVEIASHSGDIGDQDPYTDIRIVQIGSGELFCLAETETGWYQLDSSVALEGPDKFWFEFN